MTIDDNIGEHGQHYMAQERETVALIVDPSFGAQLEAVAARCHIWVVDTPANRPVVEKIWNAQKGQEESLMTTIFSADLEAPPEQVALDHLYMVDLHHGEYSQNPPWNTLEVYGAGPSPQLLSLERIRL